LTVRLLAFAASLRRDSINRKLLGPAVELARAAGAQVDVAHYSEFEMPIFNADLQQASGFPAGAEALARRVRETDGMLIVSPEYNYSLPGTLKNAIDWVSRMRPMPLRGKSALLISASDSAAGGIRGLWQLRIPLEGLGVVVYPDMFWLPHALSAFDGSGALTDPKLAERLGGVVRGYLEMAGKLSKPKA